MKKIRVAILFGGSSSEYEISLASAASVLKNVNQEKYEIMKIGISKEGNFYLYEGSVEEIENNCWLKKENTKEITFSTNPKDHGIYILESGTRIRIDVVFPVLHGKNGEDGRLQGLLELANIPYVGCNMTSSAICMDKYLTHQLVEKENILVPKSYAFQKKEDIETILKKENQMQYPLFVKPIKGGSSIGITEVKRKEELLKAIELAYAYDDAIVIEEKIEGIEVGCAILGNDQIIVGEVDEIELQNDFYDTFEKYNAKTSKIHLPARMSVEEREKLKNIALKIYKILGCSDFARVDLFYTKEKKIFLNEVNTIPGFTSHSRYPNMLKHIGLSYEEILERLIELGLEK